jgi:MFS family permease
MRFISIYFRVFVFVCAVLLSVTASSATASSEVNELLDQAETLMHMGVVDKGASRSFEEARALVETAASRFKELDLSPAESRSLSLELEAVQEDLRILTELYAERFYGIFPLVRLISSTSLEDEGLAFTEQMDHPPDTAAVVTAARKFLNQIDKYRHPHIVVTSVPADRRLENVVSELLLRDGRSTPQSRRALVAALSEEDLAALDRGEINSQLVDRLNAALASVNLIVLTVGQPVVFDNASVRSVQGDYYIHAKSVRSESFEHFGFARDRRDQLRSIKVASLLLLVLAVTWSAFVPWSPTKPMKVFPRIIIGAGFFVFGRVFITVAVTFLRKAIPDSSAMIAAAWWWPALVGLLAIIGGGLVAWIGVAMLTNKLPGARGGRAVGSMFALVALGACSYFVTPLLLLDGSRGFASLVPFVATSVGLAVVFGLGARTGPPVPHYFTVGPLLLAPLAGISLLMASPWLLWVVTGLASILCLAAWIRHRLKLAHGTEEPEPSAEEAALADQQKLVKLSKKLGKKL